MADLVPSTPEEVAQAHTDKMLAAAQSQEDLANPSQETPAETPPETPEGVAPVVRPDDIPEKFWDAEKGEVNVAALLKSQQDAEAALRAKMDPKSDKAEQADDPPTEEASEAPEGDAVSAARAEFAESGKLSEEMYTRLASEAKLTRADVDAYIEGQNAIVSSLQNAAFSEFDGGADTYKAAAEWARENMSEDAIAALDVQLASRNPAIVKAGAAALARQYSENADVAPKVVVAGKGESSSVGFFQSSAEMVAAMSDPRYSTDSAYRESVAAKIVASDKRGVNLYQ